MHIDPTCNLNTIFGFRKVIKKLKENDILRFGFSIENMRKKIKIIEISTTLTHFQSDRLIFI